MIEVIGERKPIRGWALRQLCIQLNWFTGGDNQQYQKLFDLNDEGASLEDLALVIWLCTPDRTREGILQILEKEFGTVE